jgi:prolyl-tRNA synthetase
MIVSAPAPANEVFKALVALLKLAETPPVEIMNNHEDECKLELSELHPLQSSNDDGPKTKTTTLVGWTACIKRLCQSTVLWDAQHSLQVEEWIQAAATALLNDSSIPDLTSHQQASFVDKVNAHFLESDQTYLVGDYATAADVAVAMWLYQHAAGDGTNPTLEQVEAWQTSILANPIIQSVLTTTTMTAQPTAASSSNVIIRKLQEWNIEFTQYNHVKCMTAEELVQNVPIAAADTESHTKNLLLKDKKHGLFLVTTKSDTVVHTRALGKLLGLSGGKVNMRMADEATLKETLGAEPGSVGPLAIVNNAEKKNVTLVLDQALLDLHKIHSHPLDNTCSVVLTPTALQEYLTKAEANVVVVDFAAQAEASGGGGGGEAATAKQGGHEAKKAVNKDKKQTEKGQTLLALQWKKDENFAMWYSDVIVLSEMISYYDISGCYILRPWSYKIWELMQEWFNAEIQKLGVENSYFPLFVSKDRLEKEKDHVEGFAPEVAWVTKSGETELAKHIAIRPTSETIMYPAFADWISSHRDLPLKLNQWSNVVRWEFKYPTPFLRSREFLWQEGHTVHSTYEEAMEMVMQALDLYRRVYEELLAVPVVPGYKSEKEKFAGGDTTTTVEAYVPGSGRAIQGATSHNLGQNFGKMFDITFQDEGGKTQVAWQTSWGLTTRTIGVMVMVHGDDTGLVMPPRVAPLQAVIVPIVSKKFSREEANPYCEAILEDLKAAGIRAKFDDRTMYNPGWKYNHWEQKGVPIRIEVGPRDVEQKQARIVLRYNGEKLDMRVEGLGEMLKEKLEDIQHSMFQKAKAVRDQHLVQVTEWKDFVPNLEKNNLVLTPWCGGQHTDWEEWVKETSREESLKLHGEGEEDERTSTSLAAKTLCIPFEQPPIPEGTKCIASDIPATCWILWGRSY